jgi:hypothetical protein
MTSVDGHSAHLPRTRAEARVKTRLRQHSLRAYRLCLSLSGVLDRPRADCSTGAELATDSSSGMGGGSDLVFGAGVSTGQVQRDICTELIKSRARR